MTKPYYKPPTSINQAEIIEPEIWQKHPQLKEDITFLAGALSCTKDLEDKSKVSGALELCIDLLRRIYQQVGGGADMQVISNFTREELMDSPDILALAGFPLGKIKLLSDMFLALHFNPDNAEHVFCDMDNLHNLHCMLKNCKEEIDLLIDVSNEQYRNLHIREKKFEKLLNSCINYMEDPGDKPDLKTMAADFRSQLG